MVRRPIYQCRAPTQQKQRKMKQKKKQCNMDHKQKQMNVNQKMNQDMEPQALNGCTLALLESRRDYTSKYNAWAS